MLLFCGSTASAMAENGSPVLDGVQFSPPLTVLKTLPAPDTDCVCAYRVVGTWGSMARAWTNLLVGRPTSLRAQVAPPSIVLDRPLVAPAYTILGFFGSMTISTTEMVWSSPGWFLGPLEGAQLAPPSALLKTPAAGPAPT